MMDPQALIAALPLPATLVGADGRILAANARAAALFGLDLVGRDHVAALRRPELLDAIDEVRQLRRPVTVRFLLRRGDTDQIWQVSAAPASATANPLANAPAGVPAGASAPTPTPARPSSILLPPASWAPAGPFGSRQPGSDPAQSAPAPAPSAPLVQPQHSQPPAVLVAFEDVTPVEAAGQMRRDFVANVSHELKTPLTAVLGFIETLRTAARDDPAARERFLGIMEREAQRMNRLVSDLLSLSRVETEERLRPRQDVALLPLVKRTLATLKAIIEDSGIELVTDFPDGDFTIPGDADQLQQVLGNLIENAIKYGRKQGRVTLSLTGPQLDPVLGVPLVRLSVADQGEGFDRVHIPRLTERFYRIDNHRSRESGGTGLGLAIVKHIVSRHRGRLKIESEVGVGSCFSVLLPLTGPRSRDENEEA